MYCGFQAEAGAVALGEGAGDGNEVVVGAVPPAWAPAATGAVASSSNAPNMRAAFCRTVT